MLLQREGVLSWDFSEIGRVAPKVAPPQPIRTVKHDAWQAHPFPVPKKLLPVVEEMVRERLKKGILKPCHGPYRNP